MSVTLDIDLLRNFIAVAHAGAISRAAEQVGRTQGALSQQLQKLESAIQRPLMVRTRRGIALTVQGERFLAHAQRVLRAHDATVAEMLGASLSGELRFGCPDDYAQVFLPRLIRSFAQQHPQVAIEVVCAPTPRLLERLKDHVLDTAIIALPDSPPRDQFLRRERFVWIGAKGGDAFERDPLQLAVSSPDCLDHQAATSSLERAGRSYRIAYASESTAGLIAVVRSGLAITLMTPTAVPPDLQVLPSSTGLPKLPTVGITIKTGSRSSSELLSHFESHVRLVLPTL
jgi:DNA-binding transcriptional LysR family regulator